LNDSKLDSEIKVNLGDKFKANMRKSMDHKYSDLEVKLSSNLKQSLDDIEIQ